VRAAEGNGASPCRRHRRRGRGKRARAAFRLQASRFAVMSEHAGTSVIGAGLRRREPPRPEGRGVSREHACSGGGGGLDEASTPAQRTNQAPPRADLVPMIITPCNPDSASQGSYTLDPLVALGADALAPDLALGIKGVFLQKLGVGWENVFHEVVVRTASDVFACAAAAGWWYDLLPPGSRPVFAVLRFQVTGAGQPWFAEIWPPHILTLSPAYAAEPMKCWLAARGFAVTG
jgi:hypothetical protein